MMTASAVDVARLYGEERRAEAEAGRLARRLRAEARSRRASASRFGVD